MTTTTPATSWTSKQAYLVILICLAAGLVVGFLMRGSAAVVSTTSPAVAAPVTAPVTAPEPMAPPLTNPQPSSAEMKVASSRAATPVLEQLKADPKNFKLLIQAGEMYYHHGAYIEAAGYYQRALTVQDNLQVRNQYASALFYNDDADGALEQYAKVLNRDPSNDVALFNAGMVRFKAKKDSKGAVELWEKLLKANPSHPQRERVQKMIERASR
jgi:cytochrome c-type biogenesis protein CcmH/NrfG